MENKTAVFTGVSWGTTRIWDKLRAYANNVALSHSVFALPFAGIALFLAADGHPAVSDLLWILVAMVSGRSIALALNNLIDLKYDKIHPRFKQRPMVTGEVGRRDAVVFIAACVAVFLWSTAQLQPVCLWLSPIVLVFFGLYPYMKRFTCGCHLFLGATIALAPLASWIAVRGTVNLPVFVLAAAVAAWIAGFDIVYGCLDVNFDRENGLHSIPQRFGVTMALKLASLLHIICIVCFALFGLLAGLGAAYYAGVAAAAVVLCYQHAVVQPDDLTAVTQSYFMRNGLVGIFLFLSTLIGI
jgi:4-hydroxybenzoate polyprenyltransferase